MSHFPDNLYYGNESYRKTMCCSYGLCGPRSISLKCTSPLEAFASGNALVFGKAIENLCYFGDKRGTTKPASEGGETKEIRITYLPNVHLLRESIP